MASIEEYSTKERLTIANAGHCFRYYGVDRESNKKAIAIIEEYMRTRIPDLVMFCNFKPNKDGSVSVRYLSHYSPTFIGVTYIKMKDLMELKANG